jgi:hypothetical protein
MQAAIMALGVLSEAIGWRLVATRRAMVWRLMPVIFLVMGIAAVVVRSPVAATKVANGMALAVGLASGLILYYRDEGLRGDRRPVGAVPPHVVEKYQGGRRGAAE